MARLCIVLLVMTLLALVGAARAEPAIDPEEHVLWTLINDYRQEQGVQPAGLNENLMTAAEWMSEDMATNDYCSHTDSLGRSPKQRVVAFGYTQNTTTGENLACGWDTAQEAFDAWKGSPKHDAGMLNPSFWAVGIARAYDEDSTYGWYWTMDFGGRGPAWFPATPTPTAISTPTPTLGLTLVPVAIPAPTPTPTATPEPAELPSTGTKPWAR